MSYWAKIISLASPMLKDRLIELQGEDTFIKCTTGMRSNTMTDGYSSHASCGKEVFHIPVDISTFTCATCGMERKCYCARPSTFQREFRMLPRRPCLFQVGIDRRLVMTYKINAIYRHPTIISATNRERYFRLKKKAFVLIKRQWFVERDAVVTCR